MRPDSGPAVTNRPFAGDPSVQRHKPKPVIPGTKANFEGLSNQDNFNVLGIRVNPPDPVGDVGPNHYVEMINLVFAVYSKTGTRLLGPVDTGSLWAGFAIDECTEHSGDPIVIYDQFADRWILTQFTTRGLDFPNEPLNPFYNCVAISTTADPTGTYFRYAFTTGFNFPDYPKYGVWDDSYLITTREFGVVDESIYGIGVYGLERAKMIAGDPGARAVSFLLQDGRVPLDQIGDGLLPPTSTAAGYRSATLRPRSSAPRTTTPRTAPRSTRSTSGSSTSSGAPRPTASIGLTTQFPVAEFDSIFPCAPTARDCLPQPGITDPNQFLDVLSYRQRPTWRLAYRNFGATSRSSPTSRSRRFPGWPASAGTRCAATAAGTGPPAGHLRAGRRRPPLDGQHRHGPQGQHGPRLQRRQRHGRVPRHPVHRPPAADRRGQMTLGEGTVVNGTAAQTSLNSRWGDYTSMNVDPVDDCTFWYVNEYYTAEGAATAPPGNGWQTRIASFRLPGC